MIALALVVTGILASGAASDARATRPATATAAAKAMCGSMRAAPGRYKRVVWIWFENHSYNDVIGSSSAPFTNRLAARCGLATNFHNETHPSLPNYIAATSGGTQGITDDCQPDECPRRVQSIFGQVAAAGKSWASYQESMPSPCGQHKGSSAGGEYAPKHNPAAYYVPLRSGCSRRIVPLGTPSSGALARALAGNALPSFSFITPNLCNDTHDCPVSTGDAWLGRWLPKIVASPAYRSGSTAIFVTWDEGKHGDSDNCTLNTSDVGCHIATIVVSPSTRPGTRSAQLFNHYSLLRTTEELLGITPFLGHAKDASSRSMRAAFHL